MGLKDAGAYRRAARDVARPGQALFSGFNIPNKKKDEPLLEWAAALLERVPGADVNVHYSLKHQRRGDGAVEAFEHFCGRAASIGVGGVLLVTGPRGPPCDAVRVLERLGGRHPAPGAVRLGVAFNACLPSQGQRQRERERLARKLGTGLVEEVWLNTGDDAELLSSGAEYARAAAAEARAGRPVRLFGSVLLPNEAQLRQFRERPWNGVHFSEHYLSSIEGMRECTRRVLRTFRASGVEPIVESKVRTAAELQDLGHLIQDGALEAQSEEPPGAPVPARPGPAEAPGVPASWAGLREALGLKDVARAGWLRRGVEAPESVAAHSWGVAFLASQLCPASLDRGRVLEMSIVHDLAEVRVGDITPRDGVPPAEKHRLEAAAIEDMGVGGRARALFEEYEEQQTPEARFVKFLDKLDMALQAERYEGRGLDLAEFKLDASALARRHGFEALLPPRLAPERRPAASAAEAAAEAAAPPRSRPGLSRPRSP